METQDAILQRKSVRKYKSDPVPKEALLKILEAIRWAPSWANTQCWEVVVVDDPEQKKLLQAALPPTNPSFAAIVEAPLVIAVCGKKGRAGFKKGGPTTIFGDWMMFDLGIATEHLCLSARSLGLGTVHVGLLDHTKAKAVLGLPEDVEVAELIPLGYPVDDFRGPGRRDLKDFLHFNNFGTKKDL
jgi:nitroreductase